MGDDKQYVPDSQIENALVDSQQVADTLRNRHKGRYLRNYTILNAKLTQRRLWLATKHFLLTTVLLFETLWFSFVILFVISKYVISLL